MALKIGITGGIGSGKSVLCDFFKLLRIPIFEADAWARDLTNTHPKIRTGLINFFGAGIYTPDGVVDRKKLAGIIFNDQVSLREVNGLIHPVVREEFLIWAEKQDAPYVVHEAAILFESGFYKMMDFNILVSAPRIMRLERVAKRDNSTPEQISGRMDKQWKDNRKRELASIEIRNDNTELVIPQIIRIDKQLKEYGKIW